MSKQQFYLSGGLGIFMGLSASHLGYGFESMIGALVLLASMALFFPAYQNRIDRKAHEEWVRRKLEGK